MRGAVREQVKRRLRACGFDLVRYPDILAEQAPPSLSDFEPEDHAIIEEAAPFTMTSPERLFALIQAVRYIVEHNIPGDIVECGVWKGGSMIAVARTLLSLGHTDRHLYLFDTFEGMPPPTDRDVTRDGRVAEAILESVKCYSPEDETKRAVYRAGYDSKKIHFIKGRVEDTIPGEAPERIALLRLDTDWYESTSHELRHLYPRLSDAGVLIIDDYGHWCGAREATDEYMREHKIPLLLSRIDYTGRMGVKLPTTSHGT